MVNVQNYFGYLNLLLDTSGENVDLVALVAMVVMMVMVEIGWPGGLRGQREREV
jgi:hypothetical protein